MDAILVVNAGSSSIKFSMYAVRDGADLALVSKGQTDGIGSAPRLRAVDWAWRAARRPELRGRPGPGRAGGNGPGRRMAAWRIAPAMSRRGRRHPRRAREPGFFRRQSSSTTAQVPRRGRAAGFRSPRCTSRAPSSRCARCRIACPGPCRLRASTRGFTVGTRGGRPLCPARRPLPRGCPPPTAFTGCRYEYIVRRLRYRSRPRSRAERRHRASRQWLQHVCRRGRAQRGQHHRLHCARRASDGAPRCGQLDPGVVLYLVAEKGCGWKDLEGAFSTGDSGTARGLSGISNDVRVPPRERTRKARAGPRPLRVPEVRSGARRPRRRARQTRRRRVHGGHRRELAGNSP